MGFFTSQQKDTDSRGMILLEFIVLLTAVASSLANNKTKTVCCAVARSECSRYCDGRPCTDTCTYRCGIFNNNCGTWSCADVAGFSCQAPTPPPTPPPAPTPTCGGTVSCSSPPGGAAASTKYNGKCYSLFSSAMSWQDARTACRGLGGNLAAVTEDCIQTQIVDNLLPSGPGSSVYLGGLMSAPESTFTWESGDTPLPADYNNFATTPPTTGTWCIIMDPTSGSWSTQACTTTSSYICQTTDTTKAQTTVCEEAASPCSSELADLTGARASMQHGDMCYYLYNRGTTSFYEKQTYCEDKLGGSLATVSSSCLQSQIEKHLLSSSTTQNILLGGKISFPELEYYWVGRDSTFSYTNFGPSALKTVSSSKSCLTMDKGSGLWTDAACDGSTSFICQGAA